MAGGKHVTMLLIDAQRNGVLNPFWNLLARHYFHFRMTSWRLEIGFLQPGGLQALK